MRRLTLLLAFITCAFAPQAGAQTDTTTQAQAPPGAPVVVRGDTLFTLSGQLGPFSPDERAEALADRIRRLQRDPLARAGDLIVEDTLDGSDIRWGEDVVMTVTDRDARMAGMTRIATAQQYADAIQEAIRSREGAATLQGVLVGLLWTVLATVLLVLAFRAMSWLFPRIYARLDSWRGKRIPSIRIQRLELLSSDRLTDAVIVAAKVVRVAAVVVVLYIYLPLVLSFFPWTRRLSDRLVGYVVSPLTDAWRSFVAYLPDLITVGVIVALLYYVLKFIHVFFTGIRRGAIALPGFYTDWAEPTYKIVRFLVIVFGAVVIFPYLPGSDTDAFKGISVFLGVLITFGSSSAIANIVAGIVMTYMRPFQHGDRVKIADTVGDVVGKTLLVTRVRTTKNVDITIPNAMVLSSHIINYSSTAKEGGVILHTGVTIGYDVPWPRVHELLLQAAERTAGLMESSKPFVLQTSLDDFYVAYELNVYTETPNAMTRTYSDLHQHIQDVFNEAGVEIMSPHYGALRDGNQVTIPAAHLPAQYEPPAFRVQPVGGALARLAGGGAGAP